MIENVTKLFDDRLLKAIDLGSFDSPISEGWYGSVYKVKIFGKSYAIKTFKPTMHIDIEKLNVAAYDYHILKTLNQSKYYPTIHAFKEREWMLVDWIDGIPFRNVSDKESFSSQMYDAYKDSVQAGWFPDDVKGNNLLYSNGSIMIIDVGAYLPVVSNIEYSITDRIEFVLKHADTYPSVRDESPYDFKINYNGQS